MLNDLSNVLVKVMQYISPTDILSGKVQYNRISMALVKKITFAVDNHASESDIQRRLQYLSEWVFTELKDEGRKPDVAEMWVKQDYAFGVFDLINCLSSKVLKTISGEVVYKYDLLQIWHSLVGKIGTNLVVSATYAYMDYQNAITRGSFLWKEVLDHDNYAFNNILDKGLSENHFHLRCSTPYFILSWLSMMNSVRVTKTAYLLDHLDNNPRNPRVGYQGSIQNEKFSVLHLKAALIRVYLYAFLTDQPLNLAKYQVSVCWIFDRLCDCENIKEILFSLRKRCIHKLEICNIDFRNCRFLEDYLGRICQTAALAIYGDLASEEDKMKALMGEIKTRCPGLYWLFLRKFSHLEIEEQVFSKSVHLEDCLLNIIEYLNNVGMTVQLDECVSFFHGKYKEEYVQEWNKQTRRAIHSLLDDPYKLSDSRGYIQSAINAFHAGHSSLFKDYALNEVAPWDSQEWERAIISGERWLIYTMMHRRYVCNTRNQSQEDDIYNLFFAYLVIKESFRMELLLNNEKIGFDNFQVYQSRKNWFTSSFTEGEMARIAVREAFRRQNLKSLEIRIMPQNKWDDNIRTIRMYDNEIRKDRGSFYNKSIDYPFYYVFHFGKKKEEEQRENGVLRYRHEYFRRDIKKKANAILLMRMRNPDVASRLLGIDACSSEDGCRPEVFAHAFRVMKNHIVKYSYDNNKKLPQLRISYHVGEDNQDILDGLRAIDEAKLFLNIESGDRLGHALALGMNVQEWYHQNNFKISIRQHDYLDNVVWLYHKIIQYHISNQDNLLEYLENEFHKFFSRIYENELNESYIESIIRSKAQFDGKRVLPEALEYTGSNICGIRGRGHMLDFDIHAYYHSWELRGDDPKLYEDGFYKRLSSLGNLWDVHSANRRLDSENRYNMEAAILYHLYHYNDRIREVGEKPIIRELPSHMIRGIELVQRELQKDIAKAGIAIETNPTSNIMISSLADYGHHPIVSFYNKGLTCNENELYQCPQISVSINTDDLGVFTTCLSNEYALMANALEEMRDKAGKNIYKKDMIYEWLDRIREMGNEQRFSK